MIVRKDRYRPCQNVQGIGEKGRLSLRLVHTNRSFRLYSPESESVFRGFEMWLLDKKASMTLGVVGLLLLGGGGAVFVAASPFWASSNSPDPALQHNLTVQVGAVVEGKAIPIIGADVSVWNVNVNKTNDSVTIKFTRVAHAVTGTGGNVTFNLAGGNYIVIANYSGLSSVKKVSLSSDLSLTLFLHNMDCDEGRNGCRSSPITNWSGDRGEDRDE